MIKITSGRKQESVSFATEHMYLTATAAQRMAKHATSVVQ